MGTAVRAGALVAALVLHLDAGGQTVDARAARARAALALAGEATPAKPAVTPPKEGCGCKECGGKCRCESGCYTCLACARKAAGKEKGLVLWVGGPTCKDHPDVRALLADRVHCHLPTYNGSAEPRMLLECSPGAGEFWKFTADRITVGAVRGALEPSTPQAQGAPLSYYTPPLQFAAPQGACRT